MMSVYPAGRLVWHLLNIGIFSETIKSKAFIFGMSVDPHKTSKFDELPWPLTFRSEVKVTTGLKK